METEPITIKVQYIRDLRTKNAVEFNKKLETFEIITGISFDVAGLLPRDLTMLLELMATGAPMNCTFTCDQGMMNLEREETGRLIAVVK